jgi:hypothetical protein
MFHTEDMLRCFGLLITIAVLALVLQGFKRGAFKKAAVAAISDPAHTSANVEANSFGNGKGEIPHELLCPISFTLMVKDPVVARDGQTYERAAIQDWFEKAVQATNAGGGVRSPMRDDLILEDLTLVPNASLRIMARDYARANPGAD